MTYPFNKILTAAGLKFHNTVNGKAGVKLWLRPEPESEPDLDADDLEATVDKYDGVAEDDEIS